MGHVLIFYLIMEHILLGAHGLHLLAQNDINWVDPNSLSDYGSCIIKHQEHGLLFHHTKRLITKSNSIMHLILMKMSSGVSSLTKKMEYMILVYLHALCLSCVSFFQNFLNTNMVYHKVYPNIYMFLKFQLFIDFLHLPDSVNFNESP